MDLYFPTGLLGWSGVNQLVRGNLCVSIPVARGEGVGVHVHVHEACECMCVSRRVNWTMLMSWILPLPGKILPGTPRVSAADLFGHRLLVCTQTQNKLSRKLNTFKYIFQN